MPRKIVQRFCDNDMRKNKDLKRGNRICKIAIRFRVKPRAKSLLSGYLPFGVFAVKCIVASVPARKHFIFDIAILLLQHVNT